MSYNLIKTFIRKFWCCQSASKILTGKLSLILIWSDPLLCHQKVIDCNQCVGVEEHYYLVLPLNLVVFEKEKTESLPRGRGHCWPVKVQFTSMSVETGSGDYQYMNLIKMYLIVCFGKNDWAQMLLHRSYKFKNMNDSHILAAQNFKLGTYQYPNKIMDHKIFTSYSSELGCLTMAKQCFDRKL